MVIRRDDFAKILGIEPRRERGRPHKVTEHDRQLPSFRGASCADRFAALGWVRTAFIAQSSDGAEQFTAMADQADTDVPEIVGGQLRQNRDVYLIVTKCLFVALQLETLEPRTNVQVLLPRAPPHSALGRRPAIVPAWAGILEEVQMWHRQR